MGVMSKQVKENEGMVDFWELYVSSFNPCVKVREEENEVIMYGKDKAYQLQYGRNAPKRLGDSALEGQDSHFTDFRMVFGDEDISLYFDDRTRIGSALFDDWRPKVEEFASKYDLIVKEVVDESCQPRSAVLSYA